MKTVSVAVLILIATVGTFIKANFLNLVVEFQPAVTFGGHAVAVDVDPFLPNAAIVASESGGLFQTGDTGAIWSHVDSLPAFRMTDVAYSPNGQTIIATAQRDVTSTNGSGIWRSPDLGFSWTQPPGSALERSHRLKPVDSTARLKVAAP
jgi:hypothetical protein